MKKGAFTLAETLLTLAVLGVIATILIPSVVINYKFHAYSSAKQALKSTMTNAFRNMITFESRLNKAKAVEDSDDEENSKSANQVFVEDHLSKYIKFAKICSPKSGSGSDDSGIYGCGWRKGYKYADFDNNGRFQIPTKNSEIGFEGDEPMWGAVALNGTAMLISYNPECLSLSEASRKNQNNNNNNNAKNYFNPKDTACINIIYDINGSDTPNIFGQDVGFMTVFYPKRGIVGLPVYTTSIDFEKVSSYDDANNYCNKIPANKGMMMPTLEDAGSIYLNSEKLLPFVDPAGNTKLEQKTVWFSSANDPKFANFKAQEATCIKK